MCSVIKCRIADATHMKVNTLFFPDNDDDNDDIGDGDDCYYDDVSDSVKIMVTLMMVPAHVVKLNLCQKVQIVMQMTKSHFIMI